MLDTPSTDTPADIEVAERVDDIAAEDLVEESLVEEVSIDGMCGVY